MVKAVFLYTFAGMKIKELCAEERPREKMLSKGADALTNAELLAILLRTGTGGRNAVDVARELLKSCDERLGEMASLSVERMRQVDGIGPGKAVAVMAAFELGRRVALESGVEGGLRLDSPAKVYRIMLPLMRNMDHEECWCLFLNRTNALIAKERMTTGGQDFTLFDKRVIIRRALERKASSVILVHNHPSGNPFPSVEDINQTKDLHRALSSCGLQLLDHVIVAGRSYYSFSDEQVVNARGGNVIRHVAEKY
jgi:DNA repair protein RadC